MSSRTKLSAILPPPKNSIETTKRTISNQKNDKDEDDEKEVGPSNAIISQKPPPYGQRKGWKPIKKEDFQDGGAYPECQIIQYPINLNEKSNKSLTLQIDSEGNTRYDAIVKQGRRPEEIVKSQLKDLIPLNERNDKEAIAIKKRQSTRPSAEEVKETTERTRLALEKLSKSKIESNQLINKSKQNQYIRMNSNDNSSNQRIIKITEQAEDPLEPSRIRHKKLPQAPPSPPAPILRSPPRKISKEEQKLWMIPPSISNWKNPKGYTIAIDKRLAADGRGMQDIEMNDGFAQFTEALNIADKHAREQIRQRSIMQQKIAEKQKFDREEHLRQLAQRARDERSGFSINSSISRDQSEVPLVSTQYESDSNGDSDSDEEALIERDKLRQQRKIERERQSRMLNMGIEQRSRLIAREENRDISEKIALGLTKPTSSIDQIDSRLFNQQNVKSLIGNEESDVAYDKPLFETQEASAAMYRRPAKNGANIYSNDFNESMKNDRFNLGNVTKGFQGSDLQSFSKEGPILFEEKDENDDHFAIDEFLNKAKNEAIKRRNDQDDFDQKGKRKRESFD